MKPLAARTKRLAASETVRISNLIAELRAQGKEVISFSVGEPDFDTPAFVKDAAKKALDEGLTKYVPSPGMPETRKAIAEKSQRENHIPAEPANVVVMPAKMGIWASLNVLVDHGEEAILPDPAWVSYAPLVEWSGGKPVGIPLQGDDGFRMRPEAVAERITKKTKLIVLNSPANPTGGVNTPEDVKGIADLAKDHDLYVLTDEIYEKILYDGTNLSIQSLPGMMERTVTVNGLSKSHAMTGWRTGWAVAPKPIFDELNKAQSQTMTCVPPFVQRAMVAGLTGPADSVVAMTKEFKARRDLIVKGLNDTPGFHCPNPKGAFYVFPRYDFDMPSDQFTELLLKEAGVGVTPGKAFGAHGEHHIRVSYATSRANLEKGLEKIRGAVRGLKRRAAEAPQGRGAAEPTARRFRAA